MAPYFSLYNGEFASVGDIQLHVTATTQAGTGTIYTPSADYYATLRWLRPGEDHPEGLSIAVVERQREEERVARRREAEEARQTALNLLQTLLTPQEFELYTRNSVVFEPSRRVAGRVYMIWDGALYALSPKSREFSYWCIDASEYGLPEPDRVIWLLLLIRGDEGRLERTANKNRSSAVPDGCLWPLLEYMIGTGQYPTE